MKVFKTKQRLFCHKFHKACADVSTCETVGGGAIL